MTHTDTTAATRLKMSVASAAGVALATVTRGIAAVRPAAKPLHPSGEVLTGTLQRHGSAVPAGSSWVDDPGRDEVVVRLSRAIGLPVGLPDIHGIAVRVLGPETGDVLFASTGWGLLGRFVLTFGSRAGARPLTTLLPYRTVTGSVLLGARETAAQTYELSWSRTTGPWHSFAELTIGTTHPISDAPISFDPVHNQLPGLAQYPWVVRLREPAYSTARRTRRTERSRTDVDSLPGGG